MAMVTSAAGGASSLRHKSAPLLASIARTAAGTLEEALEIGYEGFGKIACTAAAKEGITAFLEKRKPDFKE